MSSRLDQINNWLYLAKRVRFQAKPLDKQHRIIERRLKEYFQVNPEARPAHDCDELPASAVEPTTAEHKLVQRKCQ